MAPGLFGFDELGNGVVLGDGTLDAETLALARLAQANCPEHAIFIEGDE
jgi:ferredoxin